MTDNINEVKKLLTAAMEEAARNVNLHFGRVVIHVDNVRIAQTQENKRGGRVEYSTMPSKEVTQKAINNKFLFAGSDKS